MHSNDRSALFGVKLFENRLERCQRQRTGREDRHSKFYEISDNLVGHPTEDCLTCGGKGFIPDDMPLSQFREMLR